ncbi:hypothetical protein BCD70_004296 [Clostridium beijerinckii]|nr:hypothetical protein [Clostridium beijerinckii]
MKEKQDLLKNDKIDSSTFLPFNIFLSHDMCDKSLAILCGKLATN